MDTSSLPEPLRTKVDRLLRRQPAIAEIVGRQIERYAMADSDDARRLAESNLEFMVAQKGRSKAWGLLVLVLVVVPVGLLLFAVRDQHAVGQAAQDGVPTTARVTRMAPGSCLVVIGKARCLELTLELHPESAEPYTASLTQGIALEWMSRVQPGSWLTVAVDPNDRHKVTFDERTMFVAPPTPPASP